MAGDHDAMDRFCGSTFWNDSYFDTSRLPNVSPCFQATVLVWTPAAFFWLMAPVLAFQLRLMQRKKTFAPLPFSPLLVLNLVLTIIAFVTSVLLIVKYFLTSAPEQGAAFFWYPLIRALTMAGIFLGQLGAQRAGLVSSGIIFNTFLLHVICSLPELYSWIERMGESHEQFTKLFDAWRCALFLIWFMAISGQTLALCFANRRSAEEVARREANVSPELDSSFLNRISLWWFNNVPIMGSRKNLEVEDLFELNRENRSEYLTALWERFWTPKLEAYNAKVREMMDEGTATSLLGDNSMNNGKDHSAHSKTNVSSKDKPKIAKPSVVFNLFQMFKWQLISAGAIKSVADVLQFANPSPMTMVGLLINMTVQAIVSNRRIKDLLVADEIDPNAVQKDAQKETSVKVEGGDFAWEAAASHSDATLQDVNLEVRTGSLIAIVGRRSAATTPSSTNSTSAAFETAEQSARTGDDEFEEYDDTNIPLAESGDVESPLSVTRKMSTVSSLARRSCSIRRTVTPPCSPSKSCEKSEGERTDAEKLIQSEAIQTGRVKSAVYVVYMRAASYFLSIMFAVLYMAYTGFQLGRNIWLSEWSDANDPAKSSGDNVPLATRLSLYAGLGVAESQCREMQVVPLSFAFALVCLIFGSLRASKGLHGPMLERILHAPMAFFGLLETRLRSAESSNRFGKDVDVVDTMLPMNFRYFMMCLTQVASTILIVCISTPVFIVVAVILVGIYVYALVGGWRKRNKGNAGCLQKFYVPTSRQLRRLESNFRSPIYSHFSESIQGASTIRAFQKMDDFVLLSNERVDRFIRVKYLSLIANRWLGIRLELLGNLVTFFAAPLCRPLQRVRIRGLGRPGRSFGQLRDELRQVSELETNIVSVERLKEYSEVDSEAPWVIEGKRPSSGWPAKGGVVLENYATRYRPGLDLVVKNISADVPPAQKIGIVGRTGAGKSSLTLALFRIIEAAEGKIVIDGVDIATIGLHDLRSGITIIPQEPVLFSGTLRFNLDPFERYSDDQIWQALEMAHLKVRLRLESCRRFTHKITEGGDNISVGQRQLVCLARALLRRSKILVLDEATAAVDVSTDALIQETIRRQFADSTVLTIAHRLNTILDYDKVMVLDSGVIREFASPQELLQDSNSAFYAMVADAKLSGNSS
ncbi:hypothetical protein M3Y99_00844400 [Aphelenchoides fujianensis]|nr:hypothetical protein M3Y99_00844400 [Aphelenchoides fujianensis]